LPVSFLWTFLADNQHAAGWSTFFDRIEDEPPSVEDGAGDLGGGERRRCYRREGEVGFFWDEEVVAADISAGSRYKRIYTFGGQNACAKGELVLSNASTCLDQVFFDNVETYTDNLYEELGDAGTRFTFSTRLMDQNGDVWNDATRERESALFTEIFALNLDNIKLSAESAYRGGTYTRAHAWDSSYGYLSDTPIPPGVTPGKLTPQEHAQQLAKYPPLF